MMSCEEGEDENTLLIFESTGSDAQQGVIHLIMTALIFERGSTVNNSM